MNVAVGDRIDLRSLAAAWKLCDEWQNVAVGRPTRDRDRNIHQPVAYCPERPWPGNRMLRQHLELEPSAAGLLDFLGKALQPDACQGVSRWRPRRHRGSRLRFRASGK